MKITSRIDNTFVSSCSFLNENYNPINELPSICQIVENDKEVNIFYGISVRIDFYIKYVDDLDTMTNSFLKSYCFYKKKQLDNEINQLTEDNDNSEYYRILIKTKKIEVEYYDMFVNMLFKFKHRININNGIIGSLIFYDYNTAKFFFEKLSKSSCYIGNVSYESRILPINNNFTKASKTKATDLQCKDYLLNQLTDKIVPTQNVNKIIEIIDERNMNQINRDTNYILFYPNNMINTFNNYKKFIDQNKNLMDSISIEFVDKKLYYNCSLFTLTTLHKNINYFNIKNIKILNNLVINNNITISSRKEVEQTQEDIDEMEFILPARQKSTLPMNTEIKKVIIKKIPKIQKDQQLINKFCTQPNQNQLKRKNEFPQKEKKVIKKQKTIEGFFNRK